LRATYVEAQTLNYECEFVIANRLTKLSDARMRNIRSKAATLCFPLLLALGSPDALAHTPGEDMLEAVQRFLTALTPEQRTHTMFTVEHPERQNWHYVPRDRKGLALGELTPDQHHLAMGLLASALSHRGFLKATTIMSLEAVLKELERGRGAVRDSELYYVTVFGTPDAQQPWGWRFEGHHLSLNFTLAGVHSTALTPSMFGSNPAEVREGSRQGLRVLGPEEDYARGLLSSLRPDQRTLAVISAEVPGDVLLVPGREARRLEPFGIPASALDADQRATLQRIVEEYLLRYRADLVEADLRRLAAVSPAQIYFAWAGTSEAGQPHYYRVQTPHFVLEYDNIQNQANHVHTVWRDLTNDFGRDILRDHYEHSKHHRR
jgi:hypothetical protein